MKILFHNHTGKVSGAERVLLMILANLDRQRFETVLLCPQAGPLTERAQRLEVTTIAVDELQARFTWRPDRLVQYFVSFVRTIRQTRLRVIDQKPDLIHANSVRSGMVISAATVGLGTPVVWHVHDLLPRHPLSSAIRFLCNISPRNRIVAVSQSVADRFRGRLLRIFPRRAPVTVIHNAVDLESCRPDSEERARTRESLGFSDADILIGSVGQLTPRKGQLELIDAFARVYSSFSKAKLLIVGEALFTHDLDYAKSLKAAAKSRGIEAAVHFLGQREDVPALMRAFDLLVVNSKAEPFGLTVVEGMASGTPVLASRVDGIAEIITHKSTGWLVEPGNDSALAGALRNFLSKPHLRDHLAVEALSAARSRFSSDRFANDFQAFYSGLPSAGKSTHQKSPRSLEVKLNPD